MPASKEICSRITGVLGEALNVDEGEITPTATLSDDVGAESIDFLDIVFRLEREFGIKIPRDELFPESIFAGDPAFVRDDVVTDQCMAELQMRIPYANLSRFDADRRVCEVPVLFTVGLLARYVIWKLA